MELSFTRRFIHLPEAIGSHQQRAQCQVWHTSLQVAVVGGAFPETPKTIHAITITLGGTPELDGWNLLLKKQHTLVNSCWLAHSTRRCYVGFQERKVIKSLIQLWALWTTVTTGLARFAYWCNAGMNVMGATYCFLIEFKGLSTEENSCLVL